jgi:hypothetical protein
MPGLTLKVSNSALFLWTHNGALSKLAITASCNATAASDELVPARTAANEYTRA